MAITFDAISNSGVKASVSTYSWSHTVANQLNRIMAITVQCRDNDNPTNRPVTGITVDGVAATLGIARLSTDTDGDDIDAEIWLGVAPTVGTITIAVTHTGTVDHAFATALSAYDALQSTTPNTTGFDEDTQGAATTDPNTTLTTTAVNCLLIDSCYHQGGSDLTVGANQTVIAQGGTNGGGDRAISSYKTATSAGASQMQWTAPVQDAFVQVALAMRSFDGGRKLSALGVG